MNDNLQHLITYLRAQQAREVVVLTDTNVNALYPNYLNDLSQHFNCHKIVIFAGEENKTIEQASAIWQELLAKDYDKSLTIINFGGGMICDLGGFVAATYKRGVCCVNYPTTLLAMIDAAIGGKTAVNLHHVKNCVGLVRQPDYVAPADTQLLQTLPHSELLSGFGELIKYALISSRALFDELTQLKTITSDNIKPEWIEQCVRFKEKIVAIDPDDRKERRILNFGHTFGHALEGFYAAQGESVPHGVAVAVGMLYESRLSMEQGYLSQEDFSAIDQLIRRFYTVPDFTAELLDNLKPYLVQDKKNSDGEIRFVRLQTIGKIADVSL